MRGQEADTSGNTSCSPRSGASSTPAAEQHEQQQVIPEACRPESGSECSTSDAQAQDVVLKVESDEKQRPGWETSLRMCKPGLTWRCITAMRRVPSYWWISIALFIVLETLAVVGSVVYARSVQTSQMDAASEVAKTSARALEKLLQDQKAPILFLSNLIMLNPHWPSFNASFPTYAKLIGRDYHFYQIEVCPYGLVAAMEFPSLDLNMTDAELYRFKLYFDLDKDLIQPGRWDWEYNMYTINQTEIVLAGPWYGEGALASGAFVLRYNVFLPAEDAPSWDMPNSSIATCPQNTCNRGNLTWWGWANTVFVFDDIASGLHPIQSYGLRYSLAPTPSKRVDEVLPLIAASTPPPNKQHQLCMNVNGFGENWYWPLCISDPDGDNFWPNWFPGLMVGVTALAVLISVMVLLVLRSRAQAMRFLEQQLQANAELAIAKEDAEEARRRIEEEKARMEVLMQRQHQLIELFGSAQPDSPRVGESTADSGVGARDRIEELRHRLARNSNARASNGATNFDIMLLELLGEGSFGKVYRGTWRGTEVAIKTMVLPPYMSGKEKREKMLIMETAISSALAHPNIVQTFTYSIENLVENDRQNRGMASSGGRADAELLSMGHVEDCLVFGGSQGASQATPGPPNGAQALAAAPSGAAAGPNEVSGAPATPASVSREGPLVRGSSSTMGNGVHGYEVRLVLEYCDRGCLHDALNQDAFMCTSGLNYWGILDTALDVTRAMVHLHMADVLHGDLKARNVMLKSSGAEGRGLVAKIADFGLAVRIDTSLQTHMSNLFQGTLTHMAPELLLHGRMSKAADVYAFGILLWELFTASEPFQGVPPALLGHQVIHEHRRPAFPMRPPDDFAQLVNECWAADPLRRPSFEEIMPRLKAMRDGLPGVTPALTPYRVSPPSGALRRLQEQSSEDQVRVQSNHLFVQGSQSGYNMLMLASNASGSSSMGMGMGAGMGASVSGFHHRKPINLQPVAEEGP